MADSMFVQFSDASESAIISYFASPQDPTAYANLGTVTPDDPRWSAFYMSIPILLREGLPEPTA